LQLCINKLFIVIKIFNFSIFMEALNPLYHQKKGPMLPVPMSMGKSDQIVSVEATLAILQELVNQCYGVNSDNSVDWSSIERLAGELLNQEIKHFQVLMYWGVARLHHQGFSALTDTAEQLTALVEYHWEQALPPLKRLRGRLSAIEWWLDRSITWIQHSIHEPLESEVWESVMTAVMQCDHMLAARCESAPVMAPLINCLKQLEVVLPPAAEEVSITPTVLVTDLNRGDIRSSEPTLIPAEDLDETNTDSCVVTVEHMLVEASPSAIADPAPPSIATEALAVVSEVQAVLDRADSAVAAGDYRGAVAQLQQGQKRLSGGERLQLTCHLADYLREAGYARLADVQIQQALALVEQHQLENWDPPLAQRVLESAFDLFNILGKTEAASDILARLCLLDAGRALYKSFTAQ
jgi:ImpA, N-terminal, type VI secretion system/Type VI secretion, EvfE, EvfF, ImpA, BimE, VC_A0119, VasJ